ncbi:kinase-like domain-containing protein [Mycena rebaudengoi]|nr:kinase-like domain-containing protein [Mycena rebaudengoi]
MRTFRRGADQHRIRLKLCQEAFMWQGLRHPNILPFIGIDRESFPLSLCMVSPWMANGTVLKYLEDHGRGDVDELLLEIARGLRYLHSRSVVHGDLRGANILITNDGRPCLADFGLTTWTDATAHSTSQRAGSTRWMAPELLFPDRFGVSFRRTAATDVYAFGCVCVELYTGQRPFAKFTEGTTMFKILSGELPDRPLMSDTLWGFVNNYMSRDCAVRHTAGAVVEDMLRIGPPGLFGGLKQYFRS